MAQGNSSGIRGAAVVLTLALGCGCSQMQKLAVNPFTQPAKDRETRFSFAQVTERDGNLHKAEKTYRELVQEKPKDPRFCHRLGVVLVRQGKLDEGIDMLNKACTLKEDDVAMMNDLGYALVLQGEFESAERELREALAIDSNNARTINNLALAVGYAGRTNEAYQLFRQIEEESEARANLAYIHSQRGDLAAAVKEYNRSLSKDPTNHTAAEALMQLAEMQHGIEAPAAPRKDVQLVAGESAEVEAESVTGHAVLDAPEPSLEVVELLGELESGVEPPASSDWQTIE